MRKEDKIIHYKEQQSEADKRIKDLKRVLGYLQVHIEDLKDDISYGIMHGYADSDFIPYEYLKTFGQVVAELKDARFLINRKSKEIRLLKNQSRLANKAICLINRNNNNG